MSCLTGVGLRERCEKELLLENGEIDETELQSPVKSESEENTKDSIVKQVSLIDMLPSVDIKRLQLKTETTS